jgi:outer membrane protein TolC
MKTQSLSFGPILLLLTAATTNAQTVPLTLAEAIDRAMQTSHRLAEAIARETGAQAGVRVRESADQPTVTLSGGYTRTNHVDPFGVSQPNGTVQIIYPDVPDNFFSRAAMLWPIYTGGRTDALQRAAEAEARAAGFDVRATRADLRLEVVRAYWALATATETLRVLNEAVARADADVRDVQARFDIGLIPPNEVASAEAQRSRQQVQQIEARNLRSSAMEDLRRLTGVAGEIEIAERLEAPAPPPGAPTAADAIPRAERQAQADRVIAADERRRSAEAGRRPTVSVNGAVDYANPNPRIFPRADRWQESWEVGVTASWSLWDGGRTAAEVAEAGAAAAAARARLDELDSLFALEIRQRLLDLDSATASLVAASDGVRSAAEARRVVTERFGVGVATSTEVLDAQLALLQSELDRTRALAAIRLAEARLDRALGR